MAIKPGPLLLLAGAAALAIAATKKKKPTDGLGDLPEPPGPGPGPVPEPEEEIELAPSGAILEPGEHGVHVGEEYILPYRTGDPEEFFVGVETKDGAMQPAVYGPNEDYVWEKETAKDFIILQFQRPGDYHFSIETGAYTLKAR